MKYLKYTMLMLLFIFTLASCETDIDKTEIVPSDKQISPILDTHPGIIIDINNNDVEDVTFTWQDADFGAPVQIQYHLMGKVGDTETLVGECFTNSFTITKKDLNGLIVNDLDVKANTAADIEAYVTANIYGTTSDTLTSNAITFNVSTFKAKLRSFYMTGNYGGWTDVGSQIFWETSGGTNIYKNLIDLSIDSDAADYPVSYFKVLSAQSWANGLGYDAVTPKWTMPDNAQADNNFSIDSTGGFIAQLTLDMNKNTLDCKVYSMISLIGSFNEWASDLVFNYDLVNSCWTTNVATFADGGEFKIRMNGKWDEAYGGPLEASDDIENGFILGGGDNMKIPSAGDYTFTLYTNRTPWVIVMNKQ